MIAFTRNGLSYPEMSFSGLYEIFELEISAYTHTHSRLHTGMHGYINFPVQLHSEGSLHSPINK